MTKSKETDSKETSKEEPKKKLQGKGFNDIKVPLTFKQGKKLYFSNKKYEVEKGYRADLKFVRAIENTSIYRDTEELSIAIHKMVYNIPKIDRFTFWNRIYTLCLDLIGYFNMAYAFEDKRVKFIDKYFETFNVLLSLLRTGSKTKIIPDKDYIATFEIIERIDTAIKSYRKATKANVQNQ